MFQYRRHVNIRIILFPCVIGIQGFVWFGVASAFPVKHSFYLINYATVAIMVFRPASVELMSQGLAKYRVKKNLVQIAPEERITITLGKVIKCLAVSKGICNVAKTFFNFLKDSRCQSP